jgi:FkbM family methyltransferase
LSSVLSFVRWLARQRGFARLTSIAQVLRLSFALRAVLVEERLRFALNELRPRGVTATYRLRGSEVAFALRHHTADVLVLDEVFAQREYELPAAVADVLGAGPTVRVVDLGANIGLFGAWVLQRFPQARIDAVEADRENAAIHRLTIAANGREASWRLVEGFAATGAGTVRFAGGLHGRSHQADEREQGSVVQTLDVMPLLGEADLIKIDVEGAEWAILGDERFIGLPARAIVLEYHQEGCPHADPKAAAEQSLRAAGYEVVPGPHKPTAGAGLMWGYREAG